MGRRAAHLEPQRQHSLGLDPDVHVGRLAGDREVADEAGIDQPVAAAVLPLLGLLVADDPEAHPHPVLVAQRRGDDHHRRDRALHVVGAAPVEPIAFEPRLELLGVGGDDVDVALQHDRGRPRGPHFRLHHRQPPHRFAGRLDISRLEPRFHKPGALDDVLLLAGLVRDQPLGQREKFELIGSDCEG